MLARPDEPPRRAILSAQRSIDGCIDERMAGGLGYTLGHGAHQRDPDVDWARRWNTTFHRRPFCARIYSAMGADGWRDRLFGISNGHPLVRWFRRRTRGPRDHARDPPSRAGRRCTDLVSLQNSLALPNPRPGARWQSPPHDGPHPARHWCRSRPARVRADVRVTRSASRTTERGSVGGHSPLIVAVPDNCGRCIGNVCPYEQQFE